MTLNYQRGDLLGANWVPVAVGGSPLAAGLALTVRDQSADLMALLLDVSNTLSGGLRARLAGIQDAASTIQAVYDADVSPYLANPGIVQGAGGLLQYFIAVGRFIQIPMRIEKVHWQSGVEAAVLYSFDAKVDSRVGLLVMPPA